MKQFLISVFLLLFRYCLAQHIACPRERPFPTKYNDCRSFKDICIQFRSDDCKSALRACEQCPLSNFTAESLYQVLKIMYGGQDKSYSQTKNETKPIQESASIGFISQKTLDKNCSQTRNETKSVQEFSTNRLLWSILIIESLLLIVLISILSYFIYQSIKNQKAPTMTKLEDIAKNQKDPTMIELKAIAKNQKNPIMKKLEDIAKNLKDPIMTKLEEIAKNQKDPTMTKLEDIARELSRLPKKRKSEKPTEICISWKDAENGLVPPGAIKVADSCIVARAKHKGEYIPGTLTKGDNFVIISYGDKVIPKPCYQVLVDTSILNKPVLEWNYVFDKEIPPGAIIGGTDNGKPLYIAKDEIGGKDVVGKYQSEYGWSYFSVGDVELKITYSIRVLCYSKATK